jgi:DNA-binding response OmpR family regulator
MPKSKILIVDDQYWIRVMLVEVLEKSGFKTFTASNSAEAVEKVKEEEPDIVILDINLPDTDGQILFTEIRKIRSDIHAVFISADECSIKKVMTTEQVLGFFVKPFDILKFATFLSKVGTS